MWRLNLARHRNLHPAPHGRIDERLLSQSDRFRAADQDLNVLALLQEIPLDIVLWEIQNIYYKMAKTTYRELYSQAQKGDERP